MTFFDFIYLVFALATSRYWYPALRRFAQEIWEIGDPEHGRNARPLLPDRSSGNLIHEARKSRTSRRAMRAAELPAVTGVGTGFARKPVKKHKNLSSRKRWEGGFGRRGM